MALDTAKKRLGASFKEDEFWVRGEEFLCEKKMGKSGAQGSRGWILGGGKGKLCEQERGERLGERKQKMNFG